MTNNNCDDTVEMLGIRRWSFVYKTYNLVKYKPHKREFIFVNKPALDHKHAAGEVKERSRNFLFAEPSLLIIVYKSHHKTAWKM